MWACFRLFCLLTNLQMAKCLKIAFKLNLFDGFWGEQHRVWIGILGRIMCIYRKLRIYNFPNKSTNASFQSGKTRGLGINLIESTPILTARTLVNLLTKFAFYCEICDTWVLCKNALPKRLNGPIVLQEQTIINFTGILCCQMYNMLLIQIISSLCEDLCSIWLSPVVSWWQFNKGIVWVTCE